MDKVLALKNELKEIVTALGDVYLNMADNYPDLFRSFDNKLNGLKSDGSTDLDDLNTEIEQTVSKQTEFLESLKKSDSQFMESMKTELDSIRTLDRYIDQIEDDSAELELISLNAMVTALKAGKNGGAFPYITEELQKVSKSSARLSSNLKTKGNDLGKIFSGFIEAINHDKNQISELIKTIASEFSQLTDSTRQFKSGSDRVLADVIGQVGHIKGPLYEIISEIQKHDIIRQSVDHVIVALDHISEDQGGDAESRLNALSYGSRVFGFCYEILEEIHIELSKNYDTFKAKSNDLNSLIRYLQEAGKSIQTSENGLSFNQNIVISQENIGASLGKLKKGSFQINMQKNLDNIYRDISSLEESYSGFSRIISWVKTINISSRVEAAKLPHLENMSYIIENITSRTDSIELSVEQVIKSITNFKKNSDDLINGFFIQSEKDALYIEKLGAELKINLDEVSEYSQYIGARMMDLQETGEQFHDFYAMVLTDLEKMKNLVDEIRNKMDIIDSEKKQYDRELNRLLEQQGLDSWELRGDEIKNLIDKFTIYIHKKKVDTDETLEMADEGASSGEITLF
ncbi:MAG: hypothetical protein PQJ58_13670 [Spirochaetales bacterium]|nr:hypothetical protein [Spirochaetales bacterium]